MRNPVSVAPKTPARASGSSTTQDVPAETMPEEEEAISSYDEMLQDQLANAFSGKDDRRQSMLSSVEYYKKKAAEARTRLEAGIEDDETALEWQTTVDNLQTEIDAATPGRAGVLQSEQRQWQEKLEARRKKLRAPVESEIDRYDRFTNMAQGSYDKFYDEHGMMRNPDFAKSFIKGFTNPRAMADSFVDGVMDTLIGLPILAASSPKLIQEYAGFIEFFHNDSRKRSEQAEIDAIVAAYGKDSREYKQIQQNQLNARLAWMRENAPNLAPILEYYNDSLVSAFNNDPEKFAQTLEERPFDVYVHALDVIPGLSHIIGGALQRGRMARRTATGRVRPSARAPSTAERVVRGVGEAADIANPEELPFRVGRGIMEGQGTRPRLVDTDAEVQQRPTAGGIPDLTPEQPTVEMRRTQGSDPDAPEWERVESDDIPEYEGAPDPNANPFVMSDVPEWESQPGSTGGDPARGDQAGEGITTDNVGEFMERVDRFLEEEVAPDDWEEPPMTTGGDPAEGDQLGDDTMSMLRRDVNETRTAAEETIESVAQAIRDSEFIDFSISDNPTLHDMANAVNAIAESNTTSPDNRHARTLSAEQLEILQPFMVVLNEHLLAIETLREEELRSGGSYSTQNPFRAGNLSATHFANDRYGTTRIQERLRLAEGMTDQQIAAMQEDAPYRFTTRQPGSVVVNLDDTGDRSVVITGAEGVRAETLRNALDVFEITELMLVDEASGLSEVAFDDFMSELNEILIPPEGATTTMTERLDAIEAIEAERGSTREAPEGVQQTQRTGTGLTDETPMSELRDHIRNEDTNLIGEVRGVMREAGHPLGEARIETFTLNDLREMAEALRNADTDTSTRMGEDVSLRGQNATLTRLEVLIRRLELLVEPEVETPEAPAAPAQPTQEPLSDASISETAQDRANEHVQEAINQLRENSAYQSQMLGSSPEIAQAVTEVYERALGRAYDDPVSAEDMNYILAPIGNLDRNDPAFRLATDIEERIFRTVIAGIREHMTSVDIDAEDTRVLRETLSQTIANYRQHIGERFEAELRQHPADTPAQVTQSDGNPRQESDLIYGYIDSTMDGADLLRRVLVAAREVGSDIGSQPIGALTIGNLRAVQGHIGGMSEYADLYDRIEAYLERIAPEVNRLVEEAMTPEIPQIEDVPSELSDLEAMLSRIENLSGDEYIQEWGTELIPRVQNLAFHLYREQHGELPEMQRGSNLVNQIMTDYVRGGRSGELADTIDHIVEQLHAGTSATPTTPESLRDTIANRESRLEELADEIEVIGDEDAIYSRESEGIWNEISRLNEEIESIRDYLADYPDAEDYSIAEANVEGLESERDSLQTQIDYGDIDISIQVEGLQELRDDLETAIAEVATQADEDFGRYLQANNLNDLDESSFADDYSDWLRDYYIENNRSAGASAYDEMNLDDYLDDPFEAPEAEPIPEETTSEQVDMVQRFDEAVNNLETRLVEEAWDQMDSLYNYSFDDFIDEDSNRGGSQTELLRATYTEIDNRLMGDLENARNEGEFWSPDEHVVNLLAAAEDIRLHLESQGLDTTEQGSTVVDAESSVGDFLGAVMTASQRRNRNTDVGTPAFEHLQDVVDYLEREVGVELDLTVQEDGVSRPMTLQDSYSAVRDSINSALEGNNPDVFLVDEQYQILEDIASVLHEIEFYGLRAPREGLGSNRQETPSSTPTDVSDSDASRLARAGSGELYIGYDRYRSPQEFVRHIYTRLQNDHGFAEAELGFNTDQMQDEFVDIRTWGDAQSFLRRRIDQAALSESGENLRSRLENRLNALNGAIEGAARQQSSEWEEPPMSYGGDPSEGDQTQGDITDESRTSSSTEPSATGSESSVPRSDTPIDSQEVTGGRAWESELAQQDLSEAGFQELAKDAISKDVYAQYQAGELDLSDHDHRTIADFLAEGNNTYTLRRLFDASTFSQGSLAVHYALKNILKDAQQRRYDRASANTYTENITRQQLQEWDEAEDIYFRIDTRGRREITGWMGEASYLDRIADEVIEAAVDNILSGNDPDALASFLEREYGIYDPDEELPDEDMLKDDLYNDLAEDDWWIDNEVSDILEQRGITWDDELQSYRSDGIYVVRTVTDVANYTMGGFFGRQADNIVEASQDFNQVVQVVRGTNERRPPQFDYVHEEDFWGEYLVSDPEVVSEFPAEMLLDVIPPEDRPDFEDLNYLRRHRISDDFEESGSFGGDPAEGDQAGEDLPTTVPEADAEAFDADRTRLEEMRERRGTRSPSYRELSLAYDVLTHEAARVAPEHGEVLRSVEKHPEIEDIIEDVWSETGDITATVTAINDFLDENELGGSTAVRAVATQGSISGEEPEGFRENISQQDEDIGYETNPFRMARAMSQDTTPGRRLGRGDDPEQVAIAVDLLEAYHEYRETGERQDDQAYETSLMFVSELSSSYLSARLLATRNIELNTAPRSEELMEEFDRLFLDEIEMGRLDDLNAGEVQDRLNELIEDALDDVYSRPIEPEDDDFEVMRQRTRERLGQVVRDRIANRSYPFEPEVDFSHNLTNVDAITNTTYNRIMDDPNITNDELIEATGIDPINGLEMIANAMTERLEEDERHFTEEQKARIRDFIEHVRNLRDNDTSMNPFMMPGDMAMPFDGYSSANPFV